MTHPLSSFVRRGSVAVATVVDPPIGDARQETRVSDIQSRIRTHYATVKQAEQDVGAEPELVEYAARWRAFMREMNDLGDRVKATFSWVTDGDLSIAEGHLNLLLAEWPGIGPSISLRKGKRINSILEEGLRHTTPRGPLDPAPEPLRVSDWRTTLPDSAATRAPAPPAPGRADEPPGAAPVAVKVAALFTLAAASIAATAAMEKGSQRALAAGSGLALTAAAAWAMFSSAAKKEEKKA